jgi:hypothetical protein
MSPASAAGVLECLRTKDAEDTDGRRTTCLILDRGYESPEDVDEGALLRSHEDDPTDVIGAHGGRYFQYPVQSALANASKGVEAVLHEAPDQDAAEVYPSGVQGGPILALQYPTDTPDWVIGAGQKVEPHRLHHSPPPPSASRPPQPRSLFRAHRPRPGTQSSTTGRRASAP